jgi:hypothetical protein
MSRNWTSAISRRPFLSGLLGILGVGVIGGIAYEVPKLFRHRYSPTPYDDLLDLLPDREAAVHLGEPGYISDTPPTIGELAGELRATIRNRSLAEVIDADLRGLRTVSINGRDVPLTIFELNGWVLPVTLMELCLFAARVDEAARQPQAYP